MSRDTHRLEIDERAVVKYFFVVNLLVVTAGLLILGLWFAEEQIGLGGIVIAALVAAIIFGVTANRWLARKQAQALRYEIGDDNLQVRKGVFFRSATVIPLNQITHVKIDQGPMLRHLGLVAVRVETAGSDAAEATLYGLRNAAQAKDAILDRSLPEQRSLPQA